MDTHICRCFHSHLDQMTLEMILQWASPEPDRSDLVDFWFRECKYLWGHLGKLLEKNASVGLCLIWIFNYHIETYTFLLWSTELPLSEFFISKYPRWEVQILNLGKRSLLVIVPTILFEMDPKASEFFLKEYNNLKVCQQWKVVYFDTLIQ